MKRSLEVETIEPHQINVGDLILFKHPKSNIGEKSNYVSGFVIEIGNEGYSGLPYVLLSKESPNNPEKGLNIGITREKPKKYEIRKRQELIRIPYNN